MSTLRQKKLAKALVENTQREEPLNKEQLVGSVGYSELSAEHKATEIIESKGVQEELKILGFDEDTAKRVVAEILDNPDLKPEPRLKAAEMVFKVHGTFAPDKHINLNVEADLSVKEREYANRLLERQRTT